MVSGPIRKDVMAAIQWSAGPHSSFRLPGVSLRLLLVLALFSVAQPNETRAQERGQSQPSMEERVQALIPDLEPYVARGMNAFDVPGDRHAQVGRLNHTRSGDDKKRCAHTGSRDDKRDFHGKQVDLHWSRAGGVAVDLEKHILRSGDLDLFAF